MIGRAVAALLDWLTDVLLAGECRPGCRCEVCDAERGGWW